MPPQTSEIFSKDDYMIINDDKAHVYRVIPKREGDMLSDSWIISQARVLGLSVGLVKIKK